MKEKEKKCMYRERVLCTFYTSNPWYQGLEVGDNFCPHPSPPFFDESGSCPVEHLQKNDPNQLMVDVATKIHSRVIWLRSGRHPMRDFMRALNQLEDFEREHGVTAQ